jgi:hypothetical protein
MLLEIREIPTTGAGCSPMDRRVFRQRTLQRLAEEFGDDLQVEWDEPGSDQHTLPTLVLGGQVLHIGGYMVWEILRPIVASALALEEGVREMEGEAREALDRSGIEADDWQEGLLTWLGRQGESSEPTPS